MHHVCWCTRLAGIQGGGGRITQAPSCLRAMQTVSKALILSLSSACSKNLLQQLHCVAAPCERAQRPTFIVAALLFPSCCADTTPAPSADACLCLPTQVVYGCGNDRFGGAGSIMHIHQEGCGHCGRVPGAESTPNQPAQAQDGTGVEGGAGALASQAAAAGANTHHTVGTHEQGEAEPCLQGAPAPETAPAPPATASAEGISPQGVHHLQGFPCRRGLFAAEAVRQLQDFYICGNPAGARHGAPITACWLPSHHCASPFFLIVKAYCTLLCLYVPDQSAIRAHTRMRPTA